MDQFARIFVRFRFPNLFRMTRFSKPMRAVDIIRKKRDAGELSREEIEFLVQGATHGTVPDYQIAAWLMAVLWRGMTPAEAAALTEAMLHSGQVIDFSDIPGAR